MNSLAQVSIIIATYNRSVYLKETLENLVNVYGSNLEFSDSEIIIVNNNSSDDTKLVSDHFANNYTYISSYLEKNQGLSHARNRGIKESKNSILIFIDDDVEVTQGWLEELILPLQKDTEIGVVGGRVLAHGNVDASWIPPRYHWVVGIYDHGSISKNVDSVMGANMAFRKSIFTEIGLFDPKLGRNGKKLAGGEEIDIQKRISSKGYRVFYNPKATLLHKINNKLNEAYILQYAYLEGVSSRKVDFRDNAFRCIIKYLYGFIMNTFFLPFKSIFKPGIGVQIRRRYFDGFLFGRQTSCRS